MTPTPTGPQAQEAGEFVLDDWMRDRSQVEGLLTHLESIGWVPDAAGDPQCYDQAAAMSADLIRKVLLPMLDGAKPPARVVSDGDLPEFPDPKWIYHASNIEGEDDLHMFADSGAVDEGCEHCERLYTAEQMQEYARAALSTLQSGAEGKDDLAMFRNTKYLLDNGEELHFHVNTTIGANTWKNGYWKTFVEGSPEDCAAALKACNGVLIATALQPGQGEEL